MAKRTVFSTVEGCMKLKLAVRWLVFRGCGKLSLFFFFFVVSMMLCGKVGWWEGLRGVEGCCPMSGSC